MAILIDFYYQIDGFYHSVNYYRSETPMDINNMPAPIATGITSLTYTDDSALPNMEYYVRFGSVSGSSEKISAEILVSTHAAWAPSDLTQPAAVWVDYENIISSAGKVSQMTDITGNGNNLIQAGSQKPNAGANSVDFVDGTALYKIGGASAFSSASSLWSFAVYKVNGSIGSYGTLLDVYHDSNYDAFSMYSGLTGSSQTSPAVKGRLMKNNSQSWMYSDKPTGTSNYVMLFIATNTNGTGEININEVSKINGALMRSGSFAELTGNVIVGSSNINGSGHQFIGSLKCFMAGKTKPTELEIQKLFGWAAHKYGLTENLPIDHPYKNTPP